MRCLCKYETGLSCTLFCKRKKNSCSIRHRRWRRSVVLWWIGADAWRFVRWRETYHIAKHDQRVLSTGHGSTAAPLATDLFSSNSTVKSQYYI